ncbi:ABC transporter permease [Pseudochelatococcus sp. B33]
MTTLEITTVPMSVSDRVKQAVTLEMVVTIAVMLILIWFVLYPLLVLLIGSVRSELSVQSGVFTLSNFASVLFESANRTAIINTIVSSLIATLFSVIIGVGLAWITSRTDTPFRHSFDNAFVIPYYLSPFVGAVAWTFLANPRIGLLNTFFMQAMGFSEAPLNIYTVTGLVFVMALYYSPIVFLFVAGALRSMDPSLEEASRMHAVGPLGTTLRVTLPVVMPAITSSALLVFLNAAGQFGIPAIIGVPMHYDVITTRIWYNLGYFPPKYTESAAFAVVLLCFSTIVVFLQHRILARKSYATVTGKGFRPSPNKLGVWRYLTLTICLLYVFMSIILPYGALFFTSFQPYLNFKFDPNLWTFDKYVEVLFRNPVTLRAILNSFILGVGGATLTIFLSLIVSYVVMRTKVPGKNFLSYLSTYPAGVPAVVFGVALLWAYIYLPIPIYGTIWMLLIAYIAHYIPFGVRATDSGFTQISRELEESSRMHGETWLGTMRKIVVPLLKPALTVGWILLFVEFIRSLSLSILLYSNDSIVMPVIIYELYETGAYPALAAFSVVQTILVFAAIYAAKKIARVDSFMQLK